MAIHEHTARKIIAQAGRPYHTSRGNTYKAVPLYDKKGRLHGHAIYMLYNDVEKEKPSFHSYWASRGYDRYK